jgi:hypothetical protein
MQKLAIDLSQFCTHPMEDRESMETPFIQGKYIYATDGIIIIRIPVISTDGVMLFDTDGIDKRATPNVSSAPWKRLDCDMPTWSPMPDIPEEELEFCIKCVGTGCWDCDCPHCNLSHDCPNCDALGKVVKLIEIMIGVACLDAKFLRRIKDLPGVVIEHPGDKLEKGLDCWQEPVAFKFDGGDGFIMPRRRTT